MGNDEQSWGMNLSIGLGDQYDCAPKKKNEPKNKRVANCLNLSLPLYPNDDDEIVSDHTTELDKTTEGLSSCNTNLEEEENAANNGVVMDKNCSRKKLGLTKEQTSMLEDCFKLHSTLNTVQKKVLAERLSLKPRQVEVWFQNKRARTKLKQTEVDCGLLKKWCENLSDENRRLKKEIQLLVEHPQSYIPLPKAKAKASLLTMCPSCHKCF